MADSTESGARLFVELALAALAAPDDGALIEVAERLVSEAFGSSVTLTAEAGALRVSRPGRDLAADHPSRTRLLDDVDRVLAAAARRLERERELEGYRGHVESIPIVTYVDRLDEWCSNVFISPNVEELLGYSPAEWLSDPRLAMVVVHPADLDRVLAGVAEVAETGHPFSAEYRLIARDGQIVWIRDYAKPETLPDGTMGLRGYLLDITESVVADRGPLISYVDFPGDEMPTAYLSPNVHEILGYDAAELTGRGSLFFDLVHPDDRAAALAHAKRALEGEAGGCEYRIRAADGRDIWLLDRSIPQFGPNREVLSVHGFMADVTAEKALARAHEEAEERYRDILEEMPGIAYVDRPDALPTTTYISPRIHGILGYTAEEIIADPELWLGSIVHPDDREQVRADIERTNAGVRLNSEFRCLARDGREVWFYEESIPQLDARGEVVAVHGYMIDVTDRKRAEMERLAAEERYRQILEEVPGIVYVDAADELASNLYVSPQVEQILGYTPQQLMENPTFFTNEVVHPDDRQRLVEQIASTNSGHRETLEYRCIARDGSIVWILDESLPQLDADGNVVAVRGFMLDVTDRRLAEERRTAAERGSRRLLEELPLITYIERVEGDDVPTEYISPQVEQILGYPAEQLMGASLHFYDLVHPDDLAQTEEHTRRAAGGEVVESEYRMRASDGRYVWFFDRSIPQLDEHGAVESVRGFMLDVTERKRSEAERRSAEIRYQTLLEETPGIVYVDAADATGSTIYISPRAEAILGYSLEEWTSSPNFFVARVLHPDDRERVLAEIAANNTGQPNASEYRCVTRDGRVVWIYDESVPQLGADGSVIATRGFMLDITDRKLAEEELERRDELLRQAQRMEAVGRLAGGIAHDFNNLLTVISGRVDLLTCGDGVTSEVREDLHEIGAAAERAAGLTRQLLAFSRQQVLQPTVLDLGEVVAGLSRMLRRLLVERITLVVKHEPALWPVLVDRSQLEQVVVNLVVNARDALPGGGTITIETRNVARQVTDDGDEAGDSVALIVSDTGIGLGEDVLPHIFEPFFTTKEVGEGTGLGLATVRGIVEQSGGRIDVESEPARGTTFTVLLPRVHAALTPARPPSPSPPAATAASILVVEDDPGVRGLVKRVLEAAGHSVVEAQDATAALVSSAELATSVDLLLTDLVMPGMNGRELAERLREREPHLKVLFMSGYTNDEVIQHRVPQSAAFIHKPFRPDELVASVHALLSRVESDPPATVDASPPHPAGEPAGTD